MTTPTAAERLLLDTEPQSTDLYLSIYEPQLALMCQVSGDYAQSTQTVNYDVTLSGTYGNISDNLFLVALVGTTPGNDDLGRTWVRTASATELRLVESDHINWQDDCYVTVLKYTEIIPVFPRIIQNPANDEDVIFYKWYDLAYSDQNTNLGSFINMGSDTADWMNAGTGTAYFTSSGTYNLVDSALSYSWSFEGALTTGSTAATPGNISWNQPGDYRVILTVTAANGATDTSVRYVSWYTPERPPILNFTFTELSGSRDGVGHSCRVRVREPIPKSKVRDGMLAIIFKRDYYGSTQQSVNNSDLGRSHIFFAGYINAGEINYTNNDGTVEFELLSPTNLMEITECFGVSVESKPNPSTWYELQNMTVLKALYHYYRWHSTVLIRQDVSQRNLNDRNIQYFDADRTSLYDAGNSLLDGSLKARMISDRLGHLWLEREASVLNNAASVLPTAMTLSKKDWMGTPTIDERHNQEVAFIETGGIGYDFSTSAAMVADAPGFAPGYRGKVERFQGLALSGQADLNQVAGNLYAWWNSRYPNVEMKLRGNFANLDIAPQETLKVSMAAADTPRGIVWDEKVFVIRGISWTFQARRLIPTVTFAEVSQGFNADTVVIPIEPPDEGEGGGSVKVPPVPTPGIGGITDCGQCTGTVAVWENGIFVMTTHNLNFIVTGGFVDVLANQTEDRVDIIFDGCSGVAVMEVVENLDYDRADIYIEGCGCTGLPCDHTYGGYLSRYSSLNPVSWGSDELPVNYADSTFPFFQAIGLYDVIVGDYTCRILCTGLFYADFIGFTFNWTTALPIEYGYVAYYYTVRFEFMGRSKTWEGYREVHNGYLWNAEPMVNLDTFTLRDCFGWSNSLVLGKIEFSIEPIGGSDPIDPRHTVGLYIAESYLEYMDYYDMNH